jgi:hypothetical protein
VTRHAPQRIRRVVAILASAGLLALVVAGPSAPATLAADPPTMTARVLLQGHARLGSWIAIEVHLVNSGPSIGGELRLQGGSQGGTRYATAVQLDSPSDKTWILHAQPPSFGQQLEVSLVSGGQTLLRQKVAVTIHDPGQLTVGVIAENGPKIVGSLSLPAVQNQQPIVVIPLKVGDLPTRIEAWSALDRLVWQDIDASTLSSEQLTAMRGWLALGGRLVIVGGTAGIGSLGAFPDDILPYRPTSTVDVAAAALTSLLGTAPKDAKDVPAMAGALIRGRALAMSGDRVIAAQAAYGSGSVTILGLDPTVGWVAEASASRALWPALIPARSDGSVAMTDDSQIVSAVGNLPSLALPPLGGLLLLLFGYIALIGPLNYIVLRRIDRREWAWVTMPILIAGFAVGAYAFGSALRGSSIIVNEVGIVRGAPDATEGRAQVYLGVFSPVRGTYQVSVPGGALLSSPISGDAFGATAASLDVVQGDPSRVRDLSVGFGSLRTIRAESQAVVPKVHGQLALVDGTLTGTIRNDSGTKLEKPAIVLGGNVKVLKDLLPGEQVEVSLVVNNQSAFGQSLSDRIFGQIFFGETRTTSENARRDQTRHLVVDQLTYDPQFGNFGRLTADSPVLLAWGRDAVVDVAVEGQSANRVSNVLFYIPLSMGVRGSVSFSGDLVKGTMTQSDAAFFNKDPQTMSFGQGSVTMAYRPIAFDGTLAVTHLRLGMSFGPDGAVRDVGGVPVEPIPARCVPDPAKLGPIILPKDCPKPLPPDQFDGVPEVELFDRTGAGAWHRLPHLTMGQTYDVTDAASYVDPGTGAVLVRFVNEKQEPVNVYLNLSIQGTVK